MARVSTYLNFSRNTEEAFLFYKAAFGTDYEGPVMRMGDGPGCDGQPLPEADKKLICMSRCPSWADMC